MISSTLVLTFGLCFTTQAAEFKDTAPAVAATALILSDWGTTLDIENHPELQEGNPVLGSHPSRGKVNAYFLGKLAVHAWMNTNAPLKKYRRLWNYTQIYWSYNAVRNNTQLGLRINF